MHTNAMKTSTWAIHDLSLAIAYGGAVFGMYALRPAVKVLKSEKDQRKVIDTAWDKFTPIDLAAHGAFAATWLIARSGGKGHKMGPETQKLLKLKDIAVAGAVVTGLAAAAAGKMLRNERSEGAQVKEGTEQSQALSKQATGLQNFLHVVGPLNKAFVGTAIILGPALVMTAVKESRRGLLSRLVR